MEPSSDLSAVRPPARYGRNTRWIAFVVYWSLFAVLTALIQHYIGFRRAGVGDAMIALVAGLALAALLATVFTYRGQGPAR
jgi:hypothetical protein